LKNAHLRFGWLTYVKSTETTTTSIKLRLDRFMGGSDSVLPLNAESRLLRLVTRSRALFTNAIAGPGFRLSPSCSLIRFGLVFPRGCVFIRIFNDKGRFYHSLNRRREKEAAATDSVPSSPRSGSAAGRAADRPLRPDVRRPSQICPRTIHSTTL
jgi:hypothetical protein